LAVADVVPSPKSHEYVRVSPSGSVPSPPNTTDSPASAILRYEKSARGARLPSWTVTAIARRREALPEVIVTTATYTPEAA
jgi:hypothetical protein